MMDLQICVLSCRPLFFFLGGGGVLTNSRIELTTVYHWGGQMGTLKNLASATKKQKFNVCLFVFFWNSILAKWFKQAECNNIKTDQKKKPHWAALGKIIPASSNLPSSSSWFSWPPHNSYASVANARVGCSRPQWQRLRERGGEGGGGGAEREGEDE